MSLGGNLKPACLPEIGRFPGPVFSLFREIGAWWPTSTPEFPAPFSAGSSPKQSTATSKNAASQSCTRPPTNFCRNPDFQVSGFPDFFWKAVDPTANQKSAGLRTDRPPKASPPAGLPRPRNFRPRFWLKRAPERPAGAAKNATPQSCVLSHTQCPRNLEIRFSGFPKFPLAKCESAARPEIGRFFSRSLHGTPAPVCPPGYPNVGPRLSPNCRPKQPTAKSENGAPRGSTPPKKSPEPRNPNFRIFCPFELLWFLARALLWRRGRPARGEACPARMQWCETGEGFPVLGLRALRQVFFAFFLLFLLLSENFVFCSICIAFSLFLVSSTIVKEVSWPAGFSTRLGVDVTHAPVSLASRYRSG